MKCVQGVSGLFFLFMACCGGSSSETPMPLEPVPHTGPEPVITSQKSPVQEEEAESESDQDAQVVETQPEAETSAPVVPGTDSNDDTASEGADEGTTESSAPAPAPESEKENSGNPTPQ